jgi:hypothetical protein
VTDGQGIYKWTDYNGDGVQQLDEFEIAEYSDLAQYIRIYTNSVRYIPSNKNKIQLALFVNPSIVFNSENKFLKRWNFNISLNSQNSFFKKDKVLVLNPFEKSDDRFLKIRIFWLPYSSIRPTNPAGTEITVSSPMITSSMRISVMKSVNSFSFPEYRILV